jgi:hypothetical protein
MLASGSVGGSRLWRTAQKSGRKGEREREKEKEKEKEREKFGRLGFAAMLSGALNSLGRRGDGAVLDKIRK